MWNKPVQVVYSPWDILPWGKEGEAGGKYLEALNPLEFKALICLDKNQRFLKSKQVVPQFSGFIYLEGSHQKLLFYFSLEKTGLRSDDVTGCSTSCMRPSLCVSTYMPCLTEETQNWGGGLGHRTTSRWGDVCFSPRFPLKKWEQTVLEQETQEAPLHVPGAWRNFCRLQRGPDQIEGRGDQAGTDCNTGMRQTCCPQRPQPVKLQSPIHRICKFLGFIFSRSLLPLAPLSLPLPLLGPISAWPDTQALQHFS